MVYHKFFCEELLGASLEISKERDTSRISRMLNVALIKAPRGHPEGRENVEDEGRRI